jgi:hypothetical protein
MEPLIPAPLDLLRTQTAARSSAGPADAHARWRFELERAQWKLHSDARPAQSAPANSAGPGDPRHQPAPAGRQTVLEQGVRRAQQDSAVAKESFLKDGQQPGATGQATRASAATGRPGFAGAPAQPRELPSSRPAPQEVPGGRAPQRTVWPNTSAFALVSENEVKAWVRDASLGEAGRKRLLRELRARLSAAGWKLDTLTVNGREEST